MVWKLLKQHISAAQLAGFFFANLCGMVIVLLSVQFYGDVLPVFTQGDSFMKKDYLVVSKKVSTLGSVVGKSSTFSEGDIANMEEQPFTKAVGTFTPARFKVYGGLGVQGMQLSTAMFFESVPNRFVDVKLNDWTFKEGQEEIPIIIPRNYLNLYNFGFAQSRNLPQLSEGVMGMMSLDIRISGRGQVKAMKGRIVGFSNRLNTILVPEDFMLWANRTYGDNETNRPSRLIVEVDNPTDERIAQYFKDNGYETEGDKLDSGKTAWFLKVIVSIVLRKVRKPPAHRIQSFARGSSLPSDEHRAEPAGFRAEYGSGCGDSFVVPRCYWENFPGFAPKFATVLVRGGRHSILTRIVSERLGNSP